MKDLIIKLIKKEPITDKDIANELEEICWNVHASCDTNCPVFRLNGNKIPVDDDSRYGCSCFKDGEKMLNFVKSKIN